MEPTSTPSNEGTISRSQKQGEQFMGFEGARQRLSLFP